MPHVVTGARLAWSDAAASPPARCAETGYAAVVQVDHAAVNRERLLDVAPEVLILRHIIWRPAGRPGWQPGQRAPSGRAGTGRRLRWWRRPTAGRRAARKKSCAHSNPVRHSDMTFDLDDARIHLRRTPDTLRALLAPLPAAWLAVNEGQGTWSPEQVLRHLIWCEVDDWIRARGVSPSMGPLSRSRRSTARAASLATRT